MQNVGISIGVLSVVMLVGCTSTENKVQSSETQSNGSVGVEAKSEGSLIINDWRLVYQGTEEKRYNVKYVRNEGDGTNGLSIDVEVNNQNRDHLDNAGESTDVCGTRIVVRGVGTSGGPYRRVHWSATILKAQNQESCVHACQNDHRDRVKECDIYYPPASQPIKHRECLDKARTKFDACIAAC